MTTKPKLLKTSQNLRLTLTEKKNYIFSQEGCILMLSFQVLLGNYRFHGFVLDSQLALIKMLECIVVILLCHWLTLSGCLRLQLSHCMRTKRELPLLELIR